MRAEDVDGWVGIVLVACGSPGNWLAWSGRGTMILPGIPAGIAMNPIHGAWPVRKAPQRQARRLPFMVSLGIFTLVLKDCQMREGFGLPTHT